jgi:predicted RNA-binding protein with TRAM domain
MYGNYGNRGGGFRSPQRNGTAPVNVGDELDVKIEAVGEKGDGIAKKDGFVLFVPNVKEGDEVRIRVTRVLRKVGFAEVVGSSTRKAGKTEEPREKEDELSEEELEAKASEDFGEEDAPAEEEAEGSSEEEPEEPVSKKLSDEDEQSDDDMDKDMDDMDEKLEKEDKKKKKLDEDEEEIEDMLDEEDSK